MIEKKTESLDNGNTYENMAHPLATSSWVKRYYPWKIFLVLLGLTLFFFIDDVLILFLMRYFGFLPRQWWTFIIISSYLFLVSLALAYAVFIQMRKHPITGIEGILGATGKSLTRVFKSGHVQVHGEIWPAQSVKPIPAGSNIIVEAVERMTLIVKSR